MGKCVGDLIYTDEIYSRLNPISDVPSDAPSNAPSSAPSIPIDCITRDGIEGLLTQFDLTIPANDVGRMYWTITGGDASEEWIWFGGEQNPTNGGPDDATLRFSMCLPKNHCYDMLIFMADTA